MDAEEVQIPTVAVSRLSRRNRPAVHVTETVIVTAAETGSVTAAENVMMSVTAVHAITMIPALSLDLRQDLLTIPAAAVTINNKRQFFALSFWLTERRGNAKLFLGTGLS